MLSPSLEDYLEEIYRFSKNLGYIRITDVAHKLNVSLPSVNKAVNILNQQGYLEYIPYKNIELTKKGKKMGAFLVKRNRILQNFLEVIGSNCDREEEAEAIEHYLSKETVAAMTRVVEFFIQRPKLQQELREFEVKNKDN
ncbi:MAG: metal-dependent transcriptional regulator [Halanaerobiales bacterium]